MADDFFEDPFDSIVREFFGGAPVRRGRRTIINGEEEDRTIDFIEDNNYVYSIFELPGFEERDINVSIRGKELQIVAKKIPSEEVQAYLAQKLSRGISITKTLPNFVSTKKHKITMKNGILEITFNKK